MSETSRLIPAGRSAEDPEFGTGGWLFMPVSDIPDDWAERTRHVGLVRLLPSEVQDFATRRYRALVDDRDEAIARLLAQGLSTSTIARRLNIASRTAQRRVARLRDQFAVRTTSELAAKLAREGF